MGELAETMGITIVTATVERMVATMPVEGNRQPYGLLHGGASAVLAETVGSVAAALHAGPDRIAVGIELVVHPPPRREVRHRHRRRDAPLARAHPGDVRDRDQRRRGPAGLYRPPDLPGARRAPAAG